MFSSSVYSHGEGALWEVKRCMNSHRSGCFTTSKQPRILMVSDRTRSNAKSSLAVRHNFGSLVKPTIFKISTRKHTCSATKMENDETLPIDFQSNSFQNGLAKNLDIFLRFSRSYVILGTILSVISTSLLCLDKMSDLTPNFIFGVLKATACMALINLYTAGINQVYDVELDKVNKPYLPIASGELSIKNGTIFATTACIMSIVFSLMIQSPPLISTILVYFICGTGYSVKIGSYGRWKMNGFLAAACITIVRGIIIPVGIFIHIQKCVLRKSIFLSRSLILGTMFTCIFSLVTAVFKDIPDFAGDKAFGSKTFTVLLGKEKVFWFCTCLMLMAYGAAVVIGGSSTMIYSKFVSILGNSALAFLVLFRALSVEISDNESISSFYQLIWKLSYVEYFLLPFVR